MSEKVRAIAFWWNRNACSQDWIRRGSKWTKGYDWGRKIMPASSLHLQLTYLCSMKHSTSPVWPETKSSKSCIDVLLPTRRHLMNPPSTSPLSLACKCLANAMTKCPTRSRLVKIHNTNLLPTRSQHSSLVVTFKKFRCFMFSTRIGKLESSLTLSQIWSRRELTKR